ncbi:MAG TPA: hypothetical protein PLL66_02830 [Bacteroidales bacterium]|nr:hypothetical protein [Bacteroidales bacterium]
MEINNDILTIAVDFDGTIVEHKYPEIGQIIPGAFEVLRELREKGHRLILWTVRDGVELQEAVDFCLENGIIFYAVNESHPNEEYNKYLSRKIDADIFIDDRNIGGFIGWNNIRKILLSESLSNETSKKEITHEIKKSFFQKLFGK